MLTDACTGGRRGAFPEEVAPGWSLKSTSMEEETRGDLDWCWGLRVAPDGPSEGHMCRGGGTSRAGGEAGAGVRRSLYFHVTLEAKGGVRICSCGRCPW